jgi:NAD(P)-dependent dehydrogenase (short-subunit alcohol dehydrogenase family)
MRIAVFGGTGTIGSAVAQALAGRHEVISVGHSSGDYQVDIALPDSILAVFAHLGQLDAVVSCAGTAAFKPLNNLTEADFALSLTNKLMGQVHLARLAMPSLRDNGSITLTSGVLAQEPIPGSAAISLVNAGLEGFTRAAALELPRGIRINVVSPPWVSETLAQMGRDPASGLPARVVAQSYVASVEGHATGTVIDPRTTA